jgi:hypothetical protein
MARRRRPGLSAPQYRPAGSDFLSISAAFHANHDRRLGGIRALPGEKVTENHKARTPFDGSKAAFLSKRAFFWLVGSRAGAVAQEVDVLSVSRVSPFVPV